MEKQKGSNECPSSGRPINYDDYRTVMPIPVSEINVSNGKLKQNEGY